MKKLILICLVSTFFLSACNTLGGIGTDIKRTGQGIEELAR